jgi:hypothetical protein
MNCPGAPAPDYIGETMRRGGTAVAVMSVVAAVLAFSGSASAATVVGSSCFANSSLGNVSIVSLKSALGSSMPAAIPSAGVITSWSFSLGLSLLPQYQANEKLKVFAPTAVPGQLKVVGESPLLSVQTGVTTSPVRIPVQSGDLLGSSLILNNNGKLEQGVLDCETKDPGDEIATVPFDPATGSTVTTVATQTGFQNPVTVTLEPDADGDLYGDETQDECPTDASTQGPCPAPKVTPPAPAPPARPAPTTLSASAAAKKGLLTVTMTSSAQATVTVGGSVQIAKGKTVKLSGSTQIVAPGSLAKFTLLFPASLKAALKQLSTKKKLSLTLTASAPGATSTSLTVKVPGELKPVRKHHHA